MQLSAIFNRWRSLKKQWSKFAKFRFKHPHPGFDIRAFPADTQITPLSFSKFRPTPEENTIEKIFDEVNSEQVKAALYTWFYFGLSENGRQMEDLTPEQIEFFKTELPLLISALYQYHKSILPKKDSQESKQTSSAVPSTENNAFSNTNSFPNLKNRYKNIIKKPD